MTPAGPQSSAPFAVDGQTLRTTAGTLTPALRCSSSTCRAIFDRSAGGLKCAICGALTRPISGYWVTTERREPRAFGLLGHRWRQVSRAFHTSRFQASKDAREAL